MSDNKKVWDCPCIGCGKARKQGREGVISELESYMGKYKTGHDLIAVSIIEVFLDKIKSEK